MARGDYERPGSEWPMAITLCVMSLAVAGCVVGSLWALVAAR